LLVLENPALLVVARESYGLFSRTTWVSQYQKDKTSLDLYEAIDDGSGITTSAGPHADHLHLAPDR